MKLRKSGLVTILGRPNVGKSTLLNRLAGEKIAIVTDKPQTTRKRISAVVCRGDTQFVFIDTPGFHKPRNRLGEVMVKAVRESADGVDAVLLMVEPVARVGIPEGLLLERQKQTGVPVILVVNKIDTVKKEILLPTIEIYRKAFDFEAVVPLSAKTGDGVGQLFDELLPHIPEGPALYPEGMVSDLHERQIVAELVREKLLNLLDQEVPHGIAVVTETLREGENGIIEVSVAISCEKASHKGIIIGKNGSMLKKVGLLMRSELEDMYGGQVLFTSWVRVRDGWRDKPEQLRELGFLDGKQP